MTRIAAMRTGWLATADRRLGNLDDAARAAIFGGNAARLYGITA